MTVEIQIRETCKECDGTGESDRSYMEACEIVKNRPQVMFFDHTAAVNNLLACDKCFGQKYIHKYIDIYTFFKLYGHIDPGEGK